MVIVQLTNGLGNNIFQYVAARMLAEYHNTDASVLLPYSGYYAESALKKLGIKISDGGYPLDNVVNITDANYLNAFDTVNAVNNLFLHGYFEDYKYYIKDVEKIKTWFPSVKKRVNNDLVLHFRGGDRLLYKNTFEYKPSPEKYLKALKNFDYDKLHIVTDMPEWRHFSALEMKNLTTHVGVPYDNMVNPQRAADYFNALVDAFSPHDPLCKKRTLADDFNFIRSFDNILFEHGTLGWWGGVLSEASRVGVYGPWRPWKGKTNKNLSQINLKGWFRWH